MAKYPASTDPTVEFAARKGWAEGTAKVPPDPGRAWNAQERAAFIESGSRPPAVLPSRKERKVNRKKRKKRRSARRKPR